MLFIGGTEGSGTRLLSIFCEKAKMDSGTELNRSLDAMSMVPFYTRWTRSYLENNYDNDEMKSHFLSCAETHIGDGDYDKGYIKEPRNIMFLPFIHSVYPDAKFIHLVRRGLSMAYSSNRRHTKHYGDLFVPGFKGWTPESAMRVWNDTNLAAFKYGTEHMGDNYLLVKFEDLCTKRPDVYEKLIGFMGCSEDAIPAMFRKVKIPDSWKRGRNHSKETIRGLEKIGKDAMEAFDYSRLQLKKGK